MNAKSILWVVVMTVVLAGGAGAAQTADDPAWYIGVGAGQGNVTRVNSWASQTDAFLATRGITSSTVIDSRTTAWKIFGGYQFNDIVAVEVAYNELGRYSGTTTISAPVSSSAGGTWDASALSVSAVATYQLASWFGLLFKGGLAATRLQANVSQLSANETRVQPVLGIGAKFDASKKIGFRAEFERFNNVGDGSTTGQSPINVMSVSGLYRF